MRVTRYLACSALAATSLAYVIPLDKRAEIAQNVAANGPQTVYVTVGDSKPSLAANIAPVQQKAAQYNTVAQAVSFQGGSGNEAQPVAQPAAQPAQPAQAAEPAASPNTVQNVQTAAPTVQTVSTPNTQAAAATPNTQTAAAAPASAPASAPAPAPAASSSSGSSPFRSLFDLIFGIGNSDSSSNSASTGTSNQASQAPAQSASTQSSSAPALSSLGGFSLGGFLSSLFGGSSSSGSSSSGSSNTNTGSNSGTVGAGSTPLTNSGSSAGGSTTLTSAGSGFSVGASIGFGSPSSSSSGSSPSSSSSGSGDYDESISAASGAKGMTYSPYTKSNNCKTAQEVASDIAKLSDYDIIRLYSTDCQGIENVLAAMSSHQTLFLGIWNIDSNSVQSGLSDIDNALKTSLRGWDAVDTISIGNERVNDGAASVQDIANAVSTAKNWIKQNAPQYTGPVVSVDTLVAVLANSGLCEISDYLAVNSHPFWDGNVQPSNSGPWLKQQITALQKVCGTSKKVVITETGWPTKGQNYGSCVPSQSNQVAALKSIVGSLGSQVLAFTMYNDYWKSPGPYGVEQYWGIFGDPSA